jgi:hypothetical protein
MGFREGRERSLVTNHRVGDKHFCISTSQFEATAHEVAEAKVHWFGKNNDGSIVLDVGQALAGRCGRSANAPRVAHRICSDRTRHKLGQSRVQCDVAAQDFVRMAFEIDPAFVEAVQHAHAG